MLAGTDVALSTTSAGDDGSSNSMPVKGNLSVRRRSSTVHWPWIGSDVVDIGMRMYIVAKPSNFAAAVIAVSSTQRAPAHESVSK